MGRNLRSPSTEAKSMKMAIRSVYRMKYVRGYSENGWRAREYEGAIFCDVRSFPRTGENQEAVRHLYYDMIRRYRYGDVRISAALRIEAQSNAVGPSGRKLLLGAMSDRGIAARACCNSRRA